MRWYAAAGRAVTLLLLGLSALSAPATGAQNGSRVTVGPYRVSVDRVTSVRKLVVGFDVPGREKAEAGAQASRTVQLQVSVNTDDPKAAAGLVTFKLEEMLVEQGRRLVSLPHYGGVLETANDSAVVRAYLYVPSFPALHSEIRSLQGEIAAYENASIEELMLPVDPAGPTTVEGRGGLKATLQSVKVEGSTARVELDLSGPEGTQLLAPLADGTHGVTLQDAQGREAAPSGGSMEHPRPGSAEYRVGFRGLRGEPKTVALRVLVRSGARRIYPFRLERIPLPVRPVAGAEQAADEE
ncbi:MAG: hypothetical protein ACK47B_11915 [Armatimonadota bacterium]